MYVYHNDHEVQPAPGVGKVFLEAKGQPFDEHLDDKYGGEAFVQINQNELQNHPLAEMNIF